MVRSVVRSFNLNLLQLRLIAIGGFYILFQMVLIFQKPFIQYEFTFSFYVSAIAIALITFLRSEIHPKFEIIFSCFEILSIIYLFQSQPLFSSFYLIMILILLFLAGLELSFFHNLILLVMTSSFISFGNLFYFNWQGMQNILNLVLFNLAFIIVSFFSYQLKIELFNLSTDLEKTSLKLKSKAELSQILIENMPIGLVALDKNSQIVFANENLSLKLKLNEKSIQEIVCLNLQNPKNEITYYHSEFGDKKYYQLDSASYYDAEYNQEINLHLIKDTTEFRHLQDQMRHKEKMAAVGQLAAGIAHEIRNPLAGISGSIELLSQDTKNPDDQKLMKIILKEIDRLNNLITEFLDYSKPEKSPDQKIDLALVIDEVLQNVRLSTTTPKDLSFHVYLKSFLIFGYADKLKQAFLNIIVNAIQAMKNVEQKKISISMDQIDDHICVAIADVGEGMNEESKKRIFEPFFTTKAKGTGLGLAITHKVFESHEAFVKVESELNKGTSFKIYFKRLKS